MMPENKLGSSFSILIPAWHVACRQIPFLWENIRCKSSLGGLLNHYYIDKKAA